MDQEHRAFLRSNYMELSKSIAESSDSVEHVTKYLFTKGIISRTMEEDIVYQRSPTIKVYRLLDIIPTRGPRAFEEFYNAILSAELWDAADILEPSKKPHQGASRVKSSDSYKPIAAPLPDEWPCQKHLDAVEANRINVVKVDTNYSEMIQKFHNCGDSHYDMTKPKRGKALIIDNEVFDHMSKRDGTQQDAKGLNRVLQQLGFDVSVKRDKSKDDSEKILESYCRMDHSDFNCFILVILSHGIRGKVCCKDYNPEDSDNDQKVLEINKICKDIANVRSLEGKPKLIFIQACQGKENNTGIESIQQETSPANTNSSAHRENEQPMETETPVIPGITIRNNLAPTTSTSKQSDVDLSRDNVDGSGPSSNQAKVPKMQDVYLALATIEDNTSFRNTAFGTWYIQALIFVLANYAFMEDLASLMTKVNRLVTKAKTTKEEMQVTEGRTNLIKDLYFFPGLPEGIE